MPINSGILSIHLLGSNHSDTKVCEDASTREEDQSSSFITEPTMESEAAEAREKQRKDTGIYQQSQLRVRLQYQSTTNPPSCPSLTLQL